jgi:hypothetical protein
MGDLRQSRIILGIHGPLDFFKVRTELLFESDQAPFGKFQISQTPAEQLREIKHLPGSVDAVDLCW